MHEISGHQGSYVSTVCISTPTWPTLHFNIKKMEMVAQRKTTVFFETN